MTHRLHIAIKLSDIEGDWQQIMQVGEAQEWRFLKADEVANTYWGLATARHCTPALEHMMHAGLQPAAPHPGLLPEGVAKMKARQVTALLWGCGVLLHQPAAVLTNLASVTQNTTGAQSHLARLGLSNLHLSASLGV